MSTTNKRLQYLFQQYLADKISAEEYAELWQLMKQDTKEDNLPAELETLWENITGEEPIIPANQWDNKMGELMHGVSAHSDDTVTAEQASLRRKYRWTVAAAIALLLCTGLYFFQKSRPDQKALVSHKVQKNDIPPGGNKAVLTLSNGSTLVLDSAVNGVIAHQGNATISKSGNGKVIYNPLNMKAAERVYNTLHTPRGGKYQLVLPDGSRVWLDAASSVRFPSSFAGDKRVVEVTGEVYFEVKEDAARPFEVTVDGMKVKVLGTHFNIMAYDDEPLIKTTLIKGRIRVNKGGSAVMLSPGDQAQVDKEGKIRLVRDVNINEIIAWRNNLFWFEDDDIQTVMRKIARWYNVDVVISDPIPQHFTGSIPRDVNVSRVFEVLQETGRIHFKIEGKTIIVTS